MKDFTTGDIVFDIIRECGSRVCRVNGLAIYRREKKIPRNLIFYHEFVKDFCCLSRLYFAKKYRLSGGEEHQILSLIRKANPDGWTNIFDKFNKDWTELLDDNRTPKEAVNFRGYWLFPDEKKRMEEVLKARFLRGEATFKRKGLYDD